MNQYDYDSNTADNLNALEHQLGMTVLAKEQAEARYDALFLQVFHEFDITVGIDEPTSFVCADGFKLARLVPNMQPQVDAALLEQAIMEFGPGETGTRMWKRVTKVVRTVDQDALAKEILKYPALGEIIDTCGAITKPKRQPSRIRKLASKQELMLLRTKQSDHPITDSMALQKAMKDAV